MSIPPVARLLPFLLLAVLVHVAVAPERPARAGSAPVLSLEEVLDHAHQALEGVVLSKHARLGAGGVVETVHRLAVDRRFVGTGGAEELVVLPGGILEDGSGMLVPGVPSLEVGERVVLFLSDRSPGTERRTTVGLEQGRYRVVEGTDGRRIAIGAGGLFARSTGGAAVHGGVEALPYEELRARIEAALQRREAGR